MVSRRVQFVGNRYFAFRAASGALASQALLFVAAEAVTIGLNAALHHAVAIHVALTLVTAVIARMATTNALFLLFSYAVWKRVFRPAKAQLAGAS